MLQPGVSCGRCLACLSGSDNECPHYEVLGYRNHPGGYAELVKVPVQNLVPIADSVPFVDAAAFPLTFLTAWHMLITRATAAARRGRPGAGRRQRRRPGGRPDRPPGRVRASSPRPGRDAKLERARALGAAEVINHHTQDIAEEIKRLTNRRGVDVVVEHVGVATWAKSVRVARAQRAPGDLRCHDRRRRRGGSARPVQQAPLDPGVVHGHEGRAHPGSEHLFAGRLKPIIDRTFPLAEAAAAQQRLEESGQFGKIVLEV